MHVITKGENASNVHIFDMLKYEVTKIILAIQAEGIELPDRCVKIWVKEYREDKLYPKIEIDLFGQELQYDLDMTDGHITETHFKVFVKSTTGVKRYDVNKSDAHVTLQRIDDIVQSLNEIIE